MRTSVIYIRAVVVGHPYPNQGGSLREISVSTLDRPHPEREKRKGDSRDIRPETRQIRPSLEAPPRPEVPVDDSREHCGARLRDTRERPQERERPAET